FVPASRAQSDGYVTNSNLRGVTPTGSYQFGAIDNINIGTGTLNLNIPIAKRPGRGLDTAVAFTYSSKIWVFACTKDVQGLTHCHWTADAIGAPALHTSPIGTVDEVAEEYDCVDRFGN